VPELPEVEVVCRELAEMIPSTSSITGWKFFRKDIRFKIPQKKLQLLVGQKIKSIRRRAKYILFELQDHFIISHLGMTGSWRRAPLGEAPLKHDHLSFGLENGDFFIFNDPRRFGFIEVVEMKQFSKRFSGLGVEPLSPETDFIALTKHFKKLKAPIKTALMNQKLIVGVGNIYASEILYASKVSPLKKSAKVTESQYQSIWQNTRAILKKAIEKGGSTIENYKSAKGAEGGFQDEFSVYGREKELCRNCHTPIRQKTMAGRSTFWCPDCQN
jgi:formamidopyrimidine-DNA glycosylase